MAELRPIAGLAPAAPADFPSERAVRQLTHSRGNVWIFTGSPFTKGNGRARATVFKEMAVVRRRATVQRISVLLRAVGSPAGEAPFVIRSIPQQPNSEETPL